MKTTHLVTGDGVTLAHRRFDPATRPVGTAFVGHGHAHHTLNMRPTLEALAALGWNVQGADLRGHGHSASERAPLAHMDVGDGWDRLVDDMRLGLETAFDGVPWEERLVIAPNIAALLVLEVLKGWPDLAAHIGLVTPPSNNRALIRMARGFMRARSVFHPADEPDELTLHQLYTFLGAQIPDRDRLIDVVSADRAVTDALLDDPRAWPTPTTGYFHEMFRGIESAWRVEDAASVREGTRVLVLYGGDDPVTSNGRFVEPMREHFARLGIGDVASHRVEGGRSGLILDEATLGVARIVDEWCRSGERVPDASVEGDVAGVSADILRRLGLDEPGAELDPDALVELCYHAIDDESRWVEMLYRVAHAAGGPDVDVERIETTLLALMPHWDRSFRLNRQVMRSAAMGAVLQNVIERFRIGIAVVSDDLTVSYANEVFAEELRRALGANAGDADVDPEADAAWATSVLHDLTDDEFRQRARSRDGEALLMAGGVPIGFHFRPAALKQTALRRDGAAGVVVLRPARAIEDRGTDAEDARLELLQFAYGLTAKEAQVAGALLDGLSPDAASGRLGVSIHTTRTHLRRVYDKVGVHGQAELVARMLAGPLGLFPAR